MCNSAQQHLSRRSLVCSGAGFKPIGYKIQHYYSPHVFIYLALHSSSWSCRHSSAQGTMQGDGQSQGSPCMGGRASCSALRVTKFCLTQLICLPACRAKLQVFYGRTNSKQEGIRLSVVCSLPCPLETALPRQLKAVSSAQTDKKSFRVWVA